MMVALYYQLVLRRFTNLYARAVKKVLYPRLALFAKGGAARTDAKGPEDDIIDSLEMAVEGATSTLLEERTFVKQLDKVAGRVGQHNKREFERLGVKIERQVSEAQLGEFAELVGDDEVILAELASAVLEGEALAGEARATGRARETAREVSGLGKLREDEPRIAAQMDGWRRDNLDLISSLADHQVSRLEEILRDAEGLTTDALRDRIVDHLGVTESKADLLARDQVLKLNAAIVQERQTGAGIESFVWTSANDERVREMHADLDGQVFRWDEEPPVTNPEGDQNFPGEDFQCRCVAYPILPELDVEGDVNADEEPEEESA